jgi:hypothetical protein
MDIEWKKYSTFSFYTNEPLSELQNGMNKMAKEKVPVKPESFSTLTVDSNITYSYIRY